MAMTKTGLVKQSKPIKKVENEEELDKFDKLAKIKKNQLKVITAKGDQINELS